MTSQLNHLLLTGATLFQEFELWEPPPGTLGEEKKHQHKAEQENRAALHLFIWVRDCPSGWSEVMLKNCCGTVQTQTIAGDVCLCVCVCVCVCVAAWLQVAILSGYGRAGAMRAMHRGVYRAYATAPHDVQATVKAVYSVSYILPAARQTVAQHIGRWLRRHAYWEGGQYSSWYALGFLALQGVTGCWWSDMPCVELPGAEAS